METKPTIYTRDFVLNEVKSLLRKLDTDKNIVYKGELFIDKTYSRQRFSEWVKEFEKDVEISDTIRTIDEILETRVNVGGLRNELNASMTKFNLINNYGWKDQQNIDHTTKGEKIIPILGGATNVSESNSDRQTTTTKEKD